MKIRTTKYIIKEGIINAYRNKLMSLASISIVTASLLIFGIFFLISVNLNYNTKILKSQPEMEVFCKPELDDAQVDTVENAIRNNGMIQSYTKVTKQEAYEKAKKILGEDDKILEGIDDSFLPVSFVIKLKDPGDSGEVVKRFKSMNGVDDVKYSQKAIDFISRFTYWIKVISGLLLTVLLVVSMFIIANTIKLTVFARRKEINIMKYVGATDWFIRWPFVIEGVIIGFIGALVAFALTGYGYNALEARISGDILSVSSDLLKFVKINEIWMKIIAIYSALGVFIGALGSVVSIRKYLRV